MTAADDASDRSDRAPEPPTRFVIQPPGEAGASGDRVLLDTSILCLENWRVLLAMPAIAAAVAVLVGVVLGPQYTSSATFRPQTDQPQASRLAGLAAQFGIVPPSGAGGESPRFYEELVTSDHLLAAVVRSEYPPPRVAGELAGSTEPRDLVAAFGVDEDDREVAVAEAVKELRERLRVSSEPETGLVEFSIRTGRSELSKAVADRIIDLVNQFNLETRQSQAQAERKFLGERVESAREELRAAEDSLKQFLLSNRSYQQSPSLRLEYERLQRRVSLRQQVYSTLAESYEQARVDEVRNTPVITVVEPPRVPPRPDSRNYVLRILVGVLLGLVLAAGWMFVRVLVDQARNREPDRYRELRDRIRSMEDGIRRTLTRLRRSRSSSGASSRD